MALNRFFLDQHLDKDIIVIKERTILHQMKNVLRLRKGDFVSFFNAYPEGLGFDFSAELKNIEGASAVFMLRGKKENTREPNKKLVLFQSLIKKEKFELVLQHATEAGVSEFIPVISARSEKKSIQQARCEKILKEAAEQSGRAIIPKLHEVVSFEKAIQLAKSFSPRTFFASEREKDNMIRGGGDRAFNLFIGPEGGWDDRELMAAGHANFEVISLGRLILRAETAAIAGSFTLLWA